jgi:hypothetical protein
VLSKACGLRKKSVRKPERKRPLGRPSSKCEENIKKDLSNECSGITCIGFVWFLQVTVKDCCAHCGEHL